MKIIKILLTILMIVILNVAVYAQSQETEAKQPLIKETLDVNAEMKGKDVLAKLIIQHDKTNKYSLNDDFIFTKNSHCVITINHIIPGNDYYSKPIVNLTLTNIKKLPIELTIKGNAAEAFKYGFRNGEEYAVSVRVFSGEGDESYVGDLMSEWRTCVEKPGQTVTVKVFGLEECGSSISGGFCATKKREPVLEQNKKGNFTLYVSNQSFAVSPVDIKIYIDGQVAVNQNFNVGHQHTWIPFQFNLPSGAHKVKIESKNGLAVLNEEFTVKNKHWAAASYWYYPETHYSPMPRHFTFEIKDQPIGFK